MLFSNDQKYITTLKLGVCDFLKLDGWERKQGNKAIFERSCSVISCSLVVIMCNLMVGFMVEPCILLISNPVLVQQMHTVCFKIVKLLKTFKTIIIALACFGLHKPSSGSLQPVLCQSCCIDFNNINCYWGFRYYVCKFFSVRNIG